MGIKGEEINLPKKPVRAADTQIPMAKNHQYPVGCAGLGPIASTIATITLVDSNHSLSPLDSSDFFNRPIAPPFTD